MASKEINYWLMKSEPHVYPWEQLEIDGSTHWDGVRNYQARNIMRDDMSVGDLVLYYSLAAYAYISWEKHNGKKNGGMGASHNGAFTKKYVSVSTQLFG